MATKDQAPPTMAADKSSSDLITGGIMSILEPSVQLLDTKVHAVRESQQELDQNIESVIADLKIISDNMPNSRDLDPHIKRLANARRKVNIVSSILHNCQDRLRKLHQHVLKNTEKKETQTKQQQSLNAILEAQLESLTAQNKAAAQQGNSSQLQSPIQDSVSHDKEVSQSEGDNPKMPEEIEPKPPEQDDLKTPEGDNPQTPVGDNPRTPKGDKTPTAERGILQIPETDNKQTPDEGGNLQTPDEGGNLQTPDEGKPQTSINTENSVPED